MRWFILHSNPRRQRENMQRKAGRLWVEPTTLELWRPCSVRTTAGVFALTDSFLMSFRAWKRSRLSHQRQIIGGSICSPAAAGLVASRWHLHRFLNKLQHLGHKTQSNKVNEFDLLKPEPVQPRRVVQRLLRPLEKKDVTSLRTVTNRRLACKVLVSSTL